MMRRRRIDWNTVLVALMALTILAAIVAIAVAHEDIEERKLRQLEQPVLETLEDSIHYFEDGY